MDVRLLDHLFVGEGSHFPLQKPGCY
nr:hypothetical protein [Halopseudomonas litoralis]